MLAHDVRHKEKYELLSDFHSLQISTRFVEEITNFFDPGSEQEIYQSTITDDGPKLKRFYPEDGEAFSSIWNKVLPLTYKHWAILNDTDVFVPGYTEAEPVQTYIEHLRRNIVITGIKEGAQMLSTISKDIDPHEAILRESLLKIFEIATEHNFIVTVF